MMTKIIIVFGLFLTIILGTPVAFAACPINGQVNPLVETCPTCPVATPCNNCGNKNPGGYDNCCEDWLNNIEGYFCRIGLSECQKCEARKAINRFLCNSKCLDPCNCGCKESKCACREYKKALKQLDCEMKEIISKCQKDDYKGIRKEIKKQVNCCHECLTWPFSKCACKCN